MIFYKAHLVNSVLNCFLLSSSLALIGFLLLIHFSYIVIFVIVFSSTVTFWAPSTLAIVHGLPAKASPWRSLPLGRLEGSPFVESILVSPSCDEM